MKKYFFTLLLFIIVLFLNLSLIYAESAGSFRGKETHGIGFGLEGAGVALFYDYAINSDFQIHNFLSSGSTKRESLFATNSITSNNSIIGATLKYFPLDDWGLYVGGGGGYITASQTVKQNVYCYQYFTSLNPSECTGSEGSNITSSTESTYSGVGLWGVAGWQGYDGYYFTIGLKPGTSMKLSEEDKTNSVIDYSNHKSTASSDWENIKSPSGVELLFGWHF